MGIILHLLEHDHLYGAFNLSAPNPIQYRDYAAFMGQITSEMILHNRRMLPSRMLEAGYTFKHPEAQAALRDLLI